MKKQAEHNNPQTPHSRGKNILGMTAYHGSPHNFDKFSIDHIDTGRPQREEFVNKLLNNPIHANNAVKEPWQMTMVEASSINAEKIIPLKSSVKIVNKKPVYTFKTTVKWGDTNKTFEIESKSQPNTTTVIERLHKKMIEQALAEGKPVPAEVLADYPALDKISSSDKLKQKLSDLESKLFDVKIANNEKLRKNNHAGAKFRSMVNSTSKTEDALKDKIDKVKNEIALLTESKPAKKALSEAAESFTYQIEKQIDAGEKLNKTQVEKVAAGFGISDLRLVKELTEYAIVRIARRIAHNTALSLYQRFDSIVKLYHLQVNLSLRTSTTIMLQQYSTPAPIAFVAGMYVASNQPPTAQYFEPSAGNGLLTIFLPEKHTFVNEIDEVRNANLRHQDYGIVTKFDASGPVSTNYRYAYLFDGVITNPPFGEMAEKGQFKVLDHQMAYEALNCMKDEGRAAIIIGGHTEFDRVGKIQSGKNRDFFVWLYANYYVEAVLNLDGHKLYSRQGTSFDVRLILVNGRRAQKGGFPPIQANGKVVIDSFDKLFDAVADLIQYQIPNYTKIHQFGIDLKMLRGSILDGISDIKVFTQDGKLYTKSPYLRDFVDFAHKLNGKWTGSYWQFDVRDEPEIRKALIKIYGTDGEFQPVLADIIIDLDKAKVSKNKSVFFAGRELFFTYSKTSSVKLGSGVIIKKGGVYSTGSSKYPSVGWSSGTIIELRDVPESLIPVNEGVTLKNAINSEQIIDPLMSFLNIKPTSKIIKLAIDLKNIQ